MKLDSLRAVRVRKSPASPCRNLLVKKWNEGYWYEDQLAVT
jgi:hypothetical protein